MDFALSLLIWGCAVEGKYDRVAAMCETRRPEGQTTLQGGGYHTMWDGDYWSMNRAGSMIVQGVPTVQRIREWQSLPWVVMDQMKQGKTVNPETGLPA